MAVTPPRRVNWNPLRLQVIASMIARHARGAVIDLGCDRGELMKLLDPHYVTRYVAVDREPGALADIPRSGPIPLDTVHASIEDYSPSITEAGAVVCAEALYFVDEPGGVLDALARRLCRLDSVIISMVTPIPEKPNWQRSVSRTWHSVERLGWPLRERARIWGHESGRDLSWDIVAFDPRRSTEPSREAEDSADR
jgi:2-polyprenyl-3-methyl-5-hydroxy-6-metoxy-1,4-benzoquinol methylase